MTQHTHSGVQEYVKKSKQQQEQLHKTNSRTRFKDRIHRRRWTRRRTGSTDISQSNTPKHKRQHQHQHQHKRAHTWRLVGAGGGGGGGARVPARGRARLTPPFPTFPERFPPPSPSRVALSMVLPAPAFPPPFPPPPPLVLLPVLPPVLLPGLPLVPLAFDVAFAASFSAAATCSRM